MQTNTHSVSGRRPTRMATQAILALSFIIATWGLQAQCPLTEIGADLHGPLGIIQTKAGNLVVAETGTPTANTGRISILDLTGARLRIQRGRQSKF